MHSPVRKQQIPWLMAAARIALGPIIVLGQGRHWSSTTLVALILTGLLSDIFDGILARRWHCDTPAGSLFDSMADTVFYAGVAIALWIGHPHLWQTNARLLAALIALEATRFAFDFAKFRKPASYHSYIAKTWGLLIAVAVIAEFATNRANTLISASLLFGIVCDLEGLAMSFILPAWRSEVKTLRAAWHLRRQILTENPAAPHSHTSLGATTILIAVLTLTLTIPAFAVEGKQVAYVGGTLPALSNGTLGELDTTSPANLVFKTSTPGAPTEFAIPYANIRSVRYTTPVAHHLGVLPAIAVGLVRHRERKHLLALSYTDKSSTIQSILFEVSKDQSQSLLQILRARSCPFTFEQ